MFEAEQQAVEAKIKAYCEAQSLPEPALQWSWIPFSGQWGISTSFFQLAAQEGRQGKKVIVLQRAQELVRQVRRQLTPEQRQVIVLKYLEDWTNEEIALALDKPIGAVKSLQHRALGALQRILIHEDDE